MTTRLEALEAVAKAADAFYEECAATKAKVPGRKGLALGHALKALDAVPRSQCGYWYQERKIGRNYSLTLRCQLLDGHAGDCDWPRKGTGRVEQAKGGRDE